MQRSFRRVGYLYAIIATLSGSTVYIFSKAALNQVTLAQFGVYWFTAALIWNLLYAMRSPETRTYSRIPASSFRRLLLIGMIEMVGTGAFYTAIFLAGNPSIPSFLRNTEYIFVTLLGVMLLKERFSKMELLGVILTFSGAFIISYRSDASFASYFAGASGFMLLSTFFYGFRTILAKKNIRVLTPTILAINRAVFLLFLSVTVLLINGESALIPGKAIFSCQ